MDNYNNALKNFKEVRRTFTTKEALKIPEINWQLNICEIISNDILKPIHETRKCFWNSKVHVYSKEKDLSNALFIEEYNNNFYCFVDRSLYKLDSLDECENVFFEKLENYLGNEIIEEYLG